MFLSDLSIARPVLGLIITLALVIFGLISYRDLGIESMPDVEFPFLTITTVYPGADPETVESEVTKKIEDEVATLPGIKNLNSTSAENVSLIFIEFELEVDIDVVAQDVRDRIARLQRDLPDNVQAPVVEKFDVLAMPIMDIAIGGNVPPQDLAAYVEDTVKPSIEVVSGVGRVETTGMREREIRIWLDSDRMASYGVSPQEIVGAIRLGHIEIPGGRVETGEREYIVVTSGELQSVDEFNDLIVASKNGTLIRLRDVAVVEDGLADLRSQARLNMVPAVGLSVIKQSGANVIEVADAVQEAIDEIKAIAPPGLTITIPTDNSSYIRDSFHEVNNHVYGGGIIAIIIVLLFLGNWRTTIIAALTIPTSIITTYIFMRLFDFTLNNVTMLAFSLMVGMLIDDGIVVLENIYRHTEMGKRPMQAAKEGSKEIAFAVLAATLTIVAVFVPVAFMRGLIGRFMYQYGITVAAGMTASYFITFLLAPMLSSRFTVGGKDNVFLFRWFDNGFRKVENGYRWLIGAALRRKGTTILIAFLAMVAALGLFSMTKKELFTEDDTSETGVSIEMPVGTSLQSLTRFTEGIEQMIMDIPEVENIYSTLGGGTLGEQNQGYIFIDLVSKQERNRTVWDIEDELREKLTGIPGAKLVVGVAGHFGSSYGFTFELIGNDREQLQSLASDFVDALHESPIFREVDTSFKSGKPEVRINIDRDRVADLGIDAYTIGSTLRLLVSGDDTVTTFSEGGRQYDVRVRLEDNYRDRPEDLSSVLVYDRDREPVEVSSFATVNISSGASQIDHSNKMRSVTIYANINDNYTLGDASKTMDELFATMVPPGVEARVIGEAEIMAESFQSMAFSLVLAIILIYMILAAQFNHFVHPLTIMISLPLSFVGAFGLLFLSRMTVNVFSLIGIIMLMGLVTRNAILVVEFTNQLRDRGMERDEALMTAGPVRLRPVAMTALATIGGMLPVALMLGGGAGVEGRAPMAVAVIGGLLASTLLTLVVVPVVYSLFDSATEWLLRVTGVVKSPTDGRAS